MTDWSKVGRRSRRKGKAFEQVVARSLSEATGRRFTSTRNSGRTDLKGDVYDVDDPFAHVIECKDRDLSIRSLLLGCTWLERAIAKAESDAHGNGCECVVFAKADGVTFFFGQGSLAGRLHDPGAGEVTDVHGRHWRRMVLGR